MTDRVHDLSTTSKGSSMAVQWYIYMSHSELQVGQVDVKIRPCPRPDRGQEGCFWSGFLNLPSLTDCQSFSLAGWNGSTQALLLYLQINKRKQVGFNSYVCDTYCTILHHSGNQIQKACHQSIWCANLVGTSLSGHHTSGHQDVYVCLLTTTWPYTETFKLNERYTRTFQICTRPTHKVQFLKFSACWHDVVEFTSSEGHG